jgi:hypothetical protein
LYAPARAADRAAGPVVMTAADELKREMDNVKVSTLPPTSVQNSPATYPMDEALATPYPNLPDPLTMNNGTKVKTASQWKARRAEILATLEREVYGIRPKSTPKVTWQVASEIKGIPVQTGNLRGGGPAAPPTVLRENDAVTRNLVGRVDNRSYPELDVTILAQEILPANAANVPVVIEFGGANFTLPEGVKPTTNACPAPARAGGPAPAPAAGRGAAPGPPAAAAGGAGRGGAGRGAAGRGGTVAAAPAPSVPAEVEQLLAKGWGFVNLNVNSVQADSGCGLTQGIIGLVNKGQPRSVTDWGVLSAWGWGASRVLDYLQTDKRVDAKRVATMGHSRNGKAALVGLALDERFSTGFISSSGEGGAKLNRRKYGETVDDVATNYYYWMGNNFLKYTGQWDKMPVDSHDLIALVAPRPIFVSGGNFPEMNADGTYRSIITATGQQQIVAFGGTSDAWVDPKGSYLAEVGASPVYELLGKKGVQTPFPKIDTPLLDADEGFYQHTSGHTPAPAWPVFIKFASKYWDRPATDHR